MTPATPPHQPPGSTSRVPAGPGFRVRLPFLRVVAWRQGGFSEKLGAEQCDKSASSRWRMFLGNSVSEMLLLPRSLSSPLSPGLTFIMRARKKGFKVPNADPATW